jgi:uncharacterized protein (TIGR02594 family)
MPKQSKAIAPAAQTSDIPPWLSVMRAITGVKEAPGDADNPQILAMRDEIARHFPDMRSYCNQYQHDETPWCGLAGAYCMAEVDIRPPFGPTDTDKWMWAKSWADPNDYNFMPISSPRPGAVVVMERQGGGHITFYESTEGSNYKCRGGNQGDAINVSSYPKSQVIALMWPKDYPLPPAPPADRPMLEEGDSGPEVASVQATLGIPADGDFGPVTEGAVKGYQAACGLTADGIVGPDTWRALDQLDARKAAGTEGLSPELVAAITQCAEASAIARYSWKDRGKAPAGYIAGVACAFGLAVIGLGEDEPAVLAMAQAERGDPNTDALTWYRSKFQELGMSNATDGVDTLRHLFAMILGLGMRESSGRYCEGRDMSASNVSPDTAEAGLFQTSWNIRSCSAWIPPLLQDYWENPNGFLETFRKGVNPDSNDLPNYGNGADGTRYQFLSKYAPSFHVFVTAIGMRYLRQHWGPINRNEVELRDDADAMLQQVQAIVESGAIPPEPEPEPEPEVATITVTVDPPGSARVVIVGGLP